MKRTNVHASHRLFAVPAIAAALLAGCATSKEPVKPMPASVPSLVVSFDCGTCQVKATVPDLIRSSYASAAAKAGVAVDDRTTVTLKIKGYVERGWFLRSVSLVGGPLAFMVRDEIDAVAVILDKEINVDYVYREPFSGIDSVAEKIGEKSFETVVK